MEEDGIEEGWLIEAQVAAKEGLLNYTKDEVQRDTLKQILDGLPQRPHKGPRRAALDHNKYHYYCDSMSKKTNRRESTMEVSASVGDVSKNDWEMQMDAITGGFVPKHDLHYQEQGFAKGSQPEAQGDD